MRGVCTAGAQDPGTGGLEPGVDRLTTLGRAAATRFNDFNERPQLSG
jgi:hypothetical protein